MKKVLCFFATFLLALALLAKPATVQAAEPTIVSGMIYEVDFQTPVHGADVTVDCNGNIKNTISVGGLYKVFFAKGLCFEDDTVYVTAVKDGVSGSNSGLVRNFCSVVNIAIINVAIPEFGFLTGAFTLISSLGAFFVIKRH